MQSDDPGWTAEWLEGFDAVVVSLGPGRPYRPADFGACADVIRDAALPLLGVCLGHQGICSVLGGTVQQAPEPVHGRRSPVLHTGVDVLAGVPSPFDAVRYHSLAVAGLLDELGAIGWTPDGVVWRPRACRPVRRRPTT
ncbi:MAG: aminodeoxychorismate/anthranilate synthase component II [Actinomycetota bacterium]|nr:aminodeoxychorismate/anthranilate synthase component II [Actinomycetota bacterium]